MKQVRAGLRFEGKNRKEEEVTLITKLMPHAIVSEQFRTVRTNLHFLMLANHFKTLAITASSKGVGKSTISANIAVAFANQGTKVLLVDGDLRRPKIHRFFDFANISGLTSSIGSALDVADRAINFSGIENLYVLPAGPIPPNPAELLASSHMDKLFEHWKSMYDLIIFDTPPLLAYTDAQIIAGKVDGMIYVVESNITRKDEVARSAELLKNVGANVLGVVYNKVPFSDQKHNYYY